MTYPPQQPGNWPDPSWPNQQPYAPPTSGVPLYADPTSGGAYPSYGYGTPPPMGGAQTTNGMSIASLVVSLVAAAGLICYGFGGYLGIVGAILGHVSRKQIRERGQGGDGMALAGIIVGWISTGIAVIATVLIVLLVVWAVNSPDYTSPSVDN